MMTTEDDAADLPLLPLDDRPGPARRLSSQRAAALVTGALSAADARAHRPGWSWRVAAAAALAVAVLGVASAAVWRSGWRLTWHSPAPVPAERRPAKVAVPPPALPRAPEEQAAPPVAPPPPAAVPRQRAAAQERRAAEDLLRLANEKRRQRHWQEADEAYGRVRRAHPGTPAWYVATMASASLKLEQLGDAPGALRLYNEALRREPHASLSEEARYGVAEVYRVLGQRDEEARALQAFLAAHPSSPLRARAEQRLQRLRGP